MALRIGSLDEKQSRIVLIAGGATALVLLGLVLWNRLHGGSAATATTPTTSATDTSSQPPATLQGVTEIYYAPGNLDSQPPVIGPPIIAPGPGAVNPPTPPAPTPPPVVAPPPPVPAPIPAPPVAAPPAPPPAPAPPPQQRTFVVKPWPQPGSSLWSISQIEYGQSTSQHINAIASANHIPNPNLIYPGQVLVIP